MVNKKSRIEHQPTFVDLFAGIGGIRLAFEQAGGVCCFTSEFDRYARQTYLANFRNIDDHSFAGDITQVNERDVPIHDVLVAGFPCQPFSIAGVSKKNSLDRPHGFADETQGTLFFDIARIVAKRRPKAIFPNPEISFRTTNRLGEGRCAPSSRMRWFLQNSRVRCRMRSGRRWRVMNHRDSSFAPHLRAL